MQVLRHYTGVPEALRHSVVALGNFDGIHRGHQEIIAQAGRLAREFGAPHAVMTFEPHPRGFFNPDLPAFRLTPFRIKARLIEALGVDCLFVFRFDRALSRLSAGEFVGDILAGGLGVQHVVVGENFGFARRREGDVPALRRLGRSNGFGVSALAQVTGPGNEAFSSTGVREYLKAGNPTRAALLLGRYHEIEGRIRSGDERSDGAPCLDLHDVICPAEGAYAVRAGIDLGAETVWHSGVALLDVRETPPGAGPLMEIHLFDEAPGIVGRHLRVALVDYLRPLPATPDPAARRAELAEDRRRAQVILASEEWVTGWPSTSFVAAAPEPPDTGGSD